VTFWTSNLGGAAFKECDFSGADLTYSSLRSAVFENCILDEVTRLPNGKHWNENADMTRFTDSQHPEFWFLPHYEIILEKPKKKRGVLSALQNLFK